jgi:glycosyltransferase involved in cell wall biosynthesis
MNSSSAIDIDIAMPTYNCALWLDDFIRSLLAQDFSNWRLVVRDDNSADDTNRCLADWQDRLRDRMVILGDSGTRNLGVSGNYTAVLAATSAPWIMSADPDDVWLHGEISSTLRAMREAESVFGADIPLAICTDARVVDHQGRPVAQSYWRWTRQNPKHTRDVVQVAMDSAALGSTMVFNRALLDLALPIPKGAPYQDWWLAMVAVAFGRLVPLPGATILYRRHATNETSDPYSGVILGAIRRTLRAPGAPRQRLRKVLD